MESKHPSTIGGGGVALQLEGTPRSTCGVGLTQPSKVDAACKGKQILSSTGGPSIGNF